jgi:hypothetical protein
MKRGPDRAFRLHWREESAPRLGEGISRTSAKGTRLHRLRIVFPQAMPMIETIRATSIREAKQFARNRYPDCLEITRVSSK